MNCFGDLFDEILLGFLVPEPKFSRLDHWEEKLECQDDTAKTDKETPSEQAEQITKTKRGKIAWHTANLK